MAPPSAASHAAQTREILVRARGDSPLAAAVARLLDARVWTRIRFGIDLVVLYLAASAALFAAPAPAGTVNHWIAAMFPLVTLALLHARRNPDERLHGSALDTAAHILGIVSLAAVLAIAAESALGGAHPIRAALRLWLFASVYLSSARITLLLVRRGAIRNQRLAAPTLIVGAGMVGERLVKRLGDDPGYGLRPAGFLDADPLTPSRRGGGRTVPVLGGPDALEQAVVQTGARHVILAFSSEPDHVLVERVKECQRLGLEVSLIPRLYEAINERTSLDH